MAYVQKGMPKLSPIRVEQHFPNLKIVENFIFTSDPTDDYNCVAWAIEKEDEWIQFPPYNSQNSYEDSVQSYIEYFTELGFEITDNTKLEEEFDKIALYTNDINEFTHVARQKPNGMWASKIGNWEDIEHTTLDALAGGSYGNPKVYMCRAKR